MKRSLEGQIKFGGVQGAGKSTIIEFLGQRLRARNIEVPVIKGSAIMAVILGCKPDEIALQDPSRRADARRRMFDQIAKEPLGIRDGHFTVPDGKGGYEKSDDVVAITRGLVIVTALPEQIRERRIETKREGRELDIEKIAYQQVVEQECATESAQKHQRPLFHFDNTDELESPSTLLRIERLADFVCDTMASTHQ